MIELWGKYSGNSTPSGKEIIGNCKSAEEAWKKLYTQLKEAQSYTKVYLLTILYTTRCRWIRQANRVDCTKSRGSWPETSWWAYRACDCHGTSYLVCYREKNPGSPDKLDHGTSPANIACSLNARQLTYHKVREDLMRALPINDDNSHSRVLLKHACQWRPKKEEQGLKVPSNSCDHVEQTFHRDYAQDVKIPQERVCYPTSKVNDHEMIKFPARSYFHMLCQSVS